MSEADEGWMGFEAVIRNHMARYPAMQISDVYKLVMQAALGSEHAIADPLAARVRLERELAELEGEYDERLMDPISAGGQIVRVHLRPFVAQGGKVETLLQAFIRTAREYRGDLQTLVDYWNIAATLGYHPAEEMDNFMRSMQAQAYPAVHHSPEYRQLYRPAYRVVKAEFFS
jgi:hypothetical protein